METDRLRFFCAIAETGSLTKASEILNISHSGLSKAMTILQQQTGNQLLRPLGRGLELTSEGRDFYQKSKVILDLVKGLSRPAEMQKATAVRIGMAEIFSIALTGKIGKEFAGGVDIFEYDAGQCELQLLNNEIDFAVSCVPFPEVELDYLKIKRVFMGVYVVNPKFAELPMEEIPFVLPSLLMKDNPLSLRTRDGWPSEAPRTRKFGANSLATALSLVDEGQGAVFIPKFVAEHLNRMRVHSRQLIEVPIARSIIQNSARDIFLLKKRGSEETTAMKIVAKVLRSQC